MGNWDVDKAMQTLVKYGFNDNDGNVLDYSRLILQSAVWLASDEQRELIDAAVDILCGEPCEDTISRHAVLDLMQMRMSGKELFKAVYELPPVTPKQRTGHWIEYTRVLIPEPINRWEQAWYCSECGYGNQECEDGSAWLEWKYCPNCGTKMVEPRESEVSDADSD